MLIRYTYIPAYTTIQHNPIRMLLMVLMAPSMDRHFNFLHFSIHFFSPHRCFFRPLEKPWWQWFLYVFLPLLLVARFVCFLSIIFFFSKASTHSNKSTLIDKFQWMNVQKPQKGLEKWVCVRMEKWYIHVNGFVNGQWSKSIPDLWIREKKRAKIHFKISKTTIEILVLNVTCIT